MPAHILQLHHLHNVLHPVAGCIAFFFREFSYIFGIDAVEVEIIHAHHIFNVPHEEQIG